MRDDEGRRGTFARFLMMCANMGKLTRRVVSLRRILRWKLRVPTLPASDFRDRYLSRSFHNPCLGPDAPIWQSLAMTARRRQASTFFVMWQQQKGIKHIKRIKQSPLADPFKSILSNQRVT